MAMNEHSTLPKAPGLEPPHQMVEYHIHNSLERWGSYPSVEMQLVYLTAPADRANIDF